jgi:hypothetical protein
MKTYLIYPLVVAKLSAVIAIALLLASYVSEKKLIKVKKTLS